MSRKLRRAGEQSTVAFAQLHPFDGEQWPGEPGLQFGDRRLHGVRGPDADDHHRDVGIAADEAGAASLAVRGAVDAEEHCGAGEPVAVQPSQTAR